jgi:hypothetical protein
MGEVVFVARNCLAEGLSVGEAAEVEALTPAIFIEVRSEVVITIRVLKWGFQLFSALTRGHILPGQSGIFVSSSLCKQS